MEYRDLEIDGSIVKVEVSEPEGHTPAGLSDNIESTFKTATKVISAVANETIDAVSMIGKKTKPSSLSVKFSLKLHADSSWVIAKLGTEANFEVTLNWEGERDGASD